MTRLLFAAEYQQGNIVGLRRLADKGVNRSEDDLLHVLDGARQIRARYFE